MHTIYFSEIENENENKPFNVLLNVLDDKIYKIYRKETILNQKKGAHST